MGQQHPQEIDKYGNLEIIQDIPDYILYKGIDRDTKDAVLIKFYFPTLNWSEEILNEFFNRISYLKFIEHDGLLPIIDFGKLNESPYIVYPFHPFMDFSASGLEALSKNEKMSRIRQIAEALDELHRQELVHGSLCPENILIAPNGNPKIFDFGLNEIFKKLLLDNMEDSFTFLSVSNLHFIASEQIEGGSPTRESDIYAFGVLVFLIIFGELPIKGSTAPEIAFLHHQNDQAWVSKVPANIPKTVIKLLIKCLENNPENRLKNFAETLLMLTQIEHELHGSKTLAGKFISKKPLSRHTALRVSGVIITLLLIAAGTVLFIFLSDRKTLSASMPESTNPEPQASATTIPDKATHPSYPTSAPEMGPTSSVPSTPSAAKELVFKPALENETGLLPDTKIDASNLKSLVEFARLGYGKPEDVALAQDGAYFAVATSSGVYLYKDGIYLSWIDPGGWATSVQFTKDDGLLGIGLLSGEIQFWDWKNETKSFSLSGHKGRITRLVFSNNGRHLYSASADRQVIIWDMKTAQLIKTIPAHKVTIEDIAISSDEKTLISVAGDSEVHVWDLQTNTNYAFSFPGTVQAIAISSDDKYIAAGGDTGVIRQWDLQTRKTRASMIPLPQRIWFLQYTRNDGYLKVGMEKGTVEVFANEKEQSLGFQEEIKPFDVAIIRDLGSDIKYNARFVSGKSALSVLWDGSVFYNSDLITKPIFDNLDRVIFSKDNRTLVAQGKRGITSAWKLGSNQEIFKVQADIPPGEPISPDSQWIALLVPKIITKNANIQVKQEIYKLYSLVTSERTRDLSAAVPDGFVRYRDDGKLLISTSLSMARVWDFSSGNEAFSRSDKQYGCMVTKSANNGEYFQVASAAGGFTNWDDHSSLNICTKGLEQMGRLMALSENLKILAYVNSNGWLEVFDPTMESKGEVIWPPKSSEKITALAVSPDGTIIATGSENGQVTFIDARSGNLLSVLKGNHSTIQDIEFSSDGSMIATAGHDGTARLFGIIAK